METCTCNKQGVFVAAVKNKISTEKNDIFNIRTQKIDCEYTLEPNGRGGSTEYPQSMFWVKNKKNRYSPAYPKFYSVKKRYKGVFIAWTCFPDYSQKMKTTA